MAKGLKLFAERTSRRLLTFFNLL